MIGDNERVFNGLNARGQLLSLQRDRSDRHVACKELRYVHDICC